MDAVARSGRVVSCRAWLGLVWCGSVFGAMPRSGYVGCCMVRFFMIAFMGAIPDRGSHELSQHAISIRRKTRGPGRP